MEFLKYLHVERFGTKEVEGIEHGKCYVFPKLDGTNASVWWNPNKGIRAGSRGRELSDEKDNFNFNSYVNKNRTLVDWMAAHNTFRLFGEYLVPHTFKHYRDDAWRKFYVFDVWDNLNEEFLKFEEYSNLISGIVDYIQPLAIVNNGDLDTFNRLVEKNTYLIKDGHGIGEGVVIKNYDFVNKYDRVTWAKIVRNEFKEDNSKIFGVPEVVGKKKVEQEIVAEFVTEALVSKTRAKIEAETTDRKTLIPRLLHTVYYELIKEEAWEFVKKHGNPVIDFKVLQKLCTIQVKNYSKDLF